MSGLRTMPRMTEAAVSGRSRVVIMCALVLAGEMIFSLPFHLPRYFRPSFLEGLGLSNTELGDVFAVYGITAMLAYFPGGLLADRLPPRLLIVGSLLATAAGGLFMAALPGPRGLGLLYAYWGLTTILLFWGAMICAVRDWGGAAAQGRAFGILDGGRGLVSAVFATAAVLVFDPGLPGAALSATDRADGLSRVAVFYAAATALAAVFAWWALPSGSARRHGSAAGLTAVMQLLRYPSLWLQAVVIVCAYCGFKGLDNYALYAFEVLHLSETEAAFFATANAYLRPVAALLAGLLADRVGLSRLSTALFCLLAVCYGTLAVISPVSLPVTLIMANLLCSAVAVFALRGIYFGLFEEGGVPRHLTGAATGLVSVVGFTPDIFFAPLAGRLLDAAPGLAGHQHYFLLLSALAIGGILAAGLLCRRPPTGRQTTT